MNISIVWEKQLREKTVLLISELSVYVASDKDCVFLDRKSNCSLNVSNKTHIQSLAAWYVLFLSIQFVLGVVIEVFVLF